MIGNDIVDLSLAQVQSNWRRKRFLEKVYSRKEQAMILKSDEPDIMVWRLWSMKESAYKAQVRLDQLIRFNPLAYKCQILSQKQGKVVYKENNFFVISDIKDDYVHSQVCSEEFDINSISKVFDMKPYQLDSEKFHTIIIANLAQIMSWKPSKITIEKNALGIPEIYVSGQKTSVLCSISHHGQYAAYQLCNQHENTISI